MIETLIRHASIVDGTGEKAYIGDIALADGRIEAIAPHVEGEAARVVEAEGLTAMPGFIDIHRHGDLVPFLSPCEGEELRQGITTFVNGNCGFSAAPSSPEWFEALREYALPIMGPIPEELQGMNYAGLLGAVEHQPLSSNMAYLVGNAALRIAVKGFDPTPLTEREAERVAGLLGEALQAGAVGLSLGLMYVPEHFYHTQELVGICAVAAKYHRPVTFHMRGEGNSLLGSLAEALDIGKRSGAPVHISHLKAAGKRNWSKLVPSALEMIARARLEGQDVTFDVYPYHAGSTALYTLLPPALQRGGVPHMLEELAKPGVRRVLTQELRQETEHWDNLIASTGWKNVVIAGGRDAALTGKTVEEIAALRGVDSETCVFDLMLENHGDVPIVLFSMDEGDVEQVLSAPGAIVISDALYSQGGIPHPRKYGAHTRFLHRYGEKLGLERAVRSCTALPAQRMGLRNRGLLLPGMAGDLLLADLSALADTATFAQPRQYPHGIRQVYVNGKLALEDGAPAGPCWGRLLRAEAK